MACATHALLPYKHFQGSTSESLYDMNYLKIILLFSVIHFAQGNPSQIIRFNMPPSGYPPFMIKETGQEPSGIMYDVLYRIASKQSLEIQIKLLPRKRVDMDLISGKVDATARAKEWTTNPESFEFTHIIMEVRDVIFSLKENPVSFEKIEDLYGMTVSTHLGYKYPMLSDGFKSKRILKSDSNSEQAMLGKTFLTRTDAAIINQTVGLWLIKHTPQWQGKFILSKKMVSGFSYRMMFNKRWAKFVEFFNQELAVMKNNGELEKIISQYK
jgi:polar amino acid transport system substrate-binding protein